MIHIYKIKSCTAVDEPLEDILQNEGKRLFDCFVEHVTGNYLNEATDKMFEDEYEGGWPVLVQGLSDWGFCINEYPEFDYKNQTEESLSNVPMNRHFFIRMSTYETPKEGTHFVFLNQYDKRVTNEELQELVNKCTSDKSETFYTINNENKLEEYGRNRC